MASITVVRLPCLEEKAGTDPTNMIDELVLWLNIGAKLAQLVTSQAKRKKKFPTDKATMLAGETRAAIIAA